MNTYIDPNDPRLIDFALGELDPQETAELEAALLLPENEAARREIEILKATILASEDALKNEPSFAVNTLSDTRRDAVLAKAHVKEVSPRSYFSGSAFRLLAAAAGLVLGVGLSLYVINPEKWLATSQLAMKDTEEAYHLGVMKLEKSELEQSAAQLFGKSKTDAIDVAGALNEKPQPLFPAPAQDALTAPVELPESRPAPAPQTEPVPEPQPEPMPDVQASPPATPAETGSGDQWDELGLNTMSQASIFGGHDVQTKGKESLEADDGTRTRLNVKADYNAKDFVPLEEFGLKDGIMNQPAKDFVLPSPPLPFPGGESYTEIQERPFTRADEQPLSTFSLHADSAAYTNIKRFLQQGQRPPKDAVRIEELINYFTYSYPQPTGEHPFSVNIEVGPCPWASGHLLAKVGLQGKNMPQEARPPANLVFLVDTSGSMERPNRLPLVRESLKTLLDMLKPEDRVGIVTYAGESKIALPSTLVSQKDIISRTIESLGAGGSTHGSAGIQDAYAMAQQNFIQKGINRVILATDGDFNVGVTNHDGLLSLIEEKRRTGVFLTVLGYGMGNLKDANLELLATKGNGNYAYIDSFSEARRILVEQLTGTLMTIAKDAKIQVEFNPAQVQSYRLLGYENRQLAHRDFNDDTKDAGEIGAGHTVTALYQIVPHGATIEPGVDNLRYQEDKSAPEPPTDQTGELMFVKLRYKQPDADTSKLLEIPVPASSLTLEESTADYRFAASVAAFGLALRDSSYKGNITFDLVRQLASSALGGDQRRAEFLDLVVTAKTLVGN